MTGREKKIFQLVHTLSYGDAISGEVLALQRCFRDLGYESEIFAINVNPHYKGMAHKFGDFPKNFNGEVLLHYSLGSPLNDLYKNLKCWRSMIYHNLTPASWFRSVNPRIVEDIERGERELPELCAITDRLIADSKFNAAELHAKGFKAQVLELPIDPERWNVETNAGVAQLLASDPGIHLLHVGRLAPNKCVEDIIKIFHFVNRFIDERSRLWLVGIDIDTELYSFSLKRLARQLHVDHAVNFCGCMADSEIKALYQGASAYICMSEHEGFCLPLIEAMHFGVPVIAYASTAVPDTVGKGGILVKEKRHAEIAELAVKAARDPAFRESLVIAGKDRASELTFEKFEASVRQLYGC